MRIVKIILGLGLLAFAGGWILFITLGAVPELAPFWIIGLWIAASGIILIGDW